MSQASTTSTTGLPASSVSDPSNPRRRAVLTGTAAVAGALAAGAAAQAALLLPSVAGSAMQAVVPHPDAALIRLGVELRQAQAALDAFEAAHPYDDLNEAFEPCGLVVDSIELLPAHTLAGLRVKAMAVAWCNGTNLEVLDPEIGISDDLGSDDRIMAGIVRDLLALPDVAMNGSAV